MVSNPVYDPYQILQKVYGEKAHLKQAIADTFIEEQYRSRTVRICYGVLENNDYLDYCLRYYAPKAPKLASNSPLTTSISIEQISLTKSKNTCLFFHTLS